MEIKNNVAIVAGGGGGLGLQTAKLLREHGAHVAVLDLNLESAMHVAQRVDGLALAADLTNPHSLEMALDKIKRELGTARICVNVAAIRHARKILSNSIPMPLEEFSRVIEVNLIGTFNLLRLCAQQMAGLDPVNNEGERGIIINTSSIAAFEGGIGQVAYSAAKGGVAALTLPAARELAKFGIRVNSIAPGAFATANILNMSTQNQQELLQAIPFPKKFADPINFAKLVLHLIENTTLNGSVIRLDAAMRLR